MAAKKKTAKKPTKKTPKKNTAHFNKLWAAIENLAELSTCKEAANIPAPIVAFFAKGLEDVVTAFYATIKNHTPTKK